jgi:mono/diheme cytochrome c family protein
MKRALLFAVLVLCACGDWDEALQRMRFQSGKYLPYQANPMFADGRAMRPLVAGAVPREALAMLKVPHEAKNGDQYVTRIPIALTPALMAKGQKRFEIICATCHGLLGDGDSLVARNMSLRPPPSLYAFADRPAGFFFEVITNGYGLMASYDEIPVDERWAVVAYVQALQKSQTANVSAAPPDVQKKLQEEKQ